MDLLLENSGIGMLCDEFLHLVKLILVASLKARRVMKYKSLVAFENHFIIDIV